jgi:hypothetical protein
MKKIKYSSAKKPSGQPTEKHALSNVEMQHPSSCPRPREDRARNVSTAVREGSVSGSHVVVAPEVGRMLCMCTCGGMAMCSVVGDRNKMQRMMRIKRPYSIEDVVQCEKS